VVRVEKMISDILAATLNFASPQAFAADNIQEVQAILSRPDILAKTFGTMEKTNGVVEAKLLQGLIQEAGEEAVSAALREELNWTGVLYAKGSKIHDFVRKGSMSFSPISYEEGKALVKPSALEKENQVPMLWPGSETIFDFSQDPETKKQFSKQGLVLSPEALGKLSAYKLSPKEVIRLLKLYSVPGLLRDKLQQMAGQGFPVLSGEALDSGLQALAALWAQEMQANQRLQSAA
jgi:hypothetical protein